MIFEMTIQFRVDQFDKGLNFYKDLFQREPDFIPHDGIAEWEIVPGSWLQLAEGEPGVNNGPLRLGVKDLNQVKIRLLSKYDLEGFKIYSREEVPVKWCTFSDPWGNLLGLFEYLDKIEEKNRVKEILNKEF